MASLCMVGMESGWAGMFNGGGVTPEKMALMILMESGLGAICTSRRPLRERDSDKFSWKDPGVPQLTRWAFSTHHQPAIASSAWFPAEVEGAEVADA